MKEKKTSIRLIAIFMAILITSLVVICFYLKPSIYIEPAGVKQPWER